jgi:replicative DNA helicase
MMLLNKALCQRQPKTTAALAPRHQRVKHALANILGNPRTVVDYLQLMSGSSGRPESRQQEVSQISRELKALAKELDVPMVALSQLSRAPENRTDHRPQLADLRESGAIEQDADVVAFIYREEQYNKQEENKNIAELIVAKQRNGPTDTVYLAFVNQFAKFADLERDALGAYLARFDRSKGSPRINRGADGF